MAGMEERISPLLLRLAVRFEAHIEGSPAPHVNQTELCSWLARSRSLGNSKCDQTAMADEMAFAFMLTVRLEFAAQLGAPDRKFNQGQSLPT